MNLYSVLTINTKDYRIDIKLGGKHNGTKRGRVEIALPKLNSFDRDWRKIKNEN
jgi:hypothetical protein